MFESPTMTVLLCISLRCSYIGCIYVYKSFVILLDYSLKYYVVTLFFSLVWPLFWSLFCLISIATPASFSCPFAWKIFSIPSLSACVGLLFWSGSLVDSICAGHVFLSIQLYCAFWLEHLIHLHLRLLLAGTYSLPLFPWYLCSSLFLLKAVFLASLAILAWGRCILLACFCLGSSLFHFLYFKQEPFWTE